MIVSLLAEGTLDLRSTENKHTFTHSKFLRNGYANGRKALAYLPTSCACTLGNKIRTTQYEGLASYDS